MLYIVDTYYHVAIILWSFLLSLINTLEFSLLINKLLIKTECFNLKKTAEEDLRVETFSFYFINKENSIVLIRLNKKNSTE